MMWTGLAVMMVGLSPCAQAKRSKAPPPPAAWSYSVSGSRTVSTTAKGEGAADMPPMLSEPWTETLSWTALGGIDHVYPDASVSELLRISAVEGPLDGRVFGLRRFDDGEVLRVERLLELADTGLVGWDPVLVALSPARPDKVTTKSPGSRALQWTARLGTARFLRSNCPASWTLVDDDGGGVEGWLGRPVEHLRYDGACSLNGRADLPGGGPVPLRGQGSVSGEVWWDAETHQILRHELSLQRTVESRWVTPGGRVQVEQDQSYTLRTEWRPADSPPVSVRPLETADLMAVMPELAAGWGACASEPGAREVVLIAGQAGRLEVRAIRAPRDPSASAPPAAAARPGFMQAPISEHATAKSEPLACWQAVADAVTLDEHDEDGVEFTFVVPWQGQAFGVPGVVDRVRPAPRALFIVTPEGGQAAVEGWLGVR